MADTELTPSSGGGAPPARPALKPRPAAPTRRLKRRTRAKLQRYAIYAVTLLVVALVVTKVDWPKVQSAFFDWDVFVSLFPRILTIAAKNTVIFAFFGFTGGLLIGLAIALMRLSSIRPYRWFATVYIELFRGIPALVTLLLIGFGLPIALGVRVPFTYGPGSLALAIVSGAYLAETIRSGIEAVPKGQLEAARSLGMSPSRAMRSIVIPQAFRIILPPLTNEFVLLLKDTSLIYVLGVTEETLELTKFGRDAMNKTFNITPMVAVALVYLLITIPLTRVVAVLERRAKKAR